MAKIIDINPKNKYRDYEIIATENYPPNYSDGICTSIDDTDLIFNLINRFSLGGEEDFIHGGTITIVIKPKDKK